MTQQAQGPQNQGVIAHLIVDGASNALDFYKKALGATEVMRMPTDDGKRLMHSEMVVNGSRVFVVDDFHDHPDHCGNGKFTSPTRAGTTSFVMHLDVPDCDAAVRRATDAGATVVMPPFDAFWGMRYAQVMDPFGHGWSFAHPLPAKN